MKNQDFGKKLVEIRNAQGLTQENVAEMCNLTVRTIQRIESGVVRPRAYTIKVISEYLGFDFFETSNTGYDVKVNQSSNRQKRRFLYYLSDLFNLKTNAMKKISILTSSISVIVVTLLLISSEITAQSEISSKNSLNVIKNNDKSISRIEVSFSENLNLDSLINIQDRLNKLGIDMIYKELKFNDTGQLTRICINVDCNDGFKGGYCSGVESLKHQERLGFYRDYNDSKNPFGTGVIKK